MPRPPKLTLSPRPHMRARTGSCTTRKSYVLQENAISVGTTRETGTVRANTHHCGGGSAAACSRAVTPSLRVIPQQSTPARSALIRRLDPVAEMRREREPNASGAKGRSPAQVGSSRCCRALFGSLMRGNRSERRSAKELVPKRSCPLEREAEEPLNALRTNASQELRLLSAGTKLRVGRNSAEFRR